MPRKGSPYGEREYLAFKARLLANPQPCQIRGSRCLGLGDSPEHVPPRSQHVHREGSGCCRLVAACHPCQLEQGGLIASGRWGDAALKAVETGSLFVEPAGIPIDDPVWERATWLNELRLNLPSEATWPRFMTAPHPDAKGSYGPEAIEWAYNNLGTDYRWWQKLAITRELEHDVDGNLVWLFVLRSTARRAGKSVLLRGKGGWRLHQAGKFGKVQEVLHTGQNLQICRKIFRPMQDWAERRKDQGYDVRRGSGDIEVRHPDESVWVLRSLLSIYGYGGSLAMVDEAWDVAPEVIDDGLTATTLEEPSPQVDLVSTAHRKATPLIPQRRIQALRELREPDVTLILEWSADRNAELGDESAWRAASPHWDRGRQRIISAEYKKVLAGQSLDPNEEDPSESFRSQYLNVWPLRVADKGQLLVDEQVWTAALGDFDPVGGLFLAVDDWHGEGVGVAAVGVDDGGRFLVGGWRYASRSDAFERVRRWFAAVPGSVVLVGATLQSDPELGEFGVDVGVRTSADARAGLVLFRELLRAGLIVVQEDAPDVFRAILDARVTKPSAGGLSLVPSRNADIVRAAVWAISEAHRAADLVAMVHGGPLPPP